MEEYKEFKKQQQFLGKRERVLKSGWRHGIVGIDDADSPKTQTFYESSRDQKLSVMGEKNKINDYRMKVLALGMGTSDQQDISDPMLKRSSSLHKHGVPDRVIEVSEGWKTLGKIPEARKDTHQRIFVPASNVHREKEEGCMNKIKIERSLKLRAEE